MSLIRDEQEKDPSIQKALKENPDYILKEVLGGKAAKTCILYRENCRASSTKETAY